MLRAVRSTDDERGVPRGVPRGVKAVTGSASLDCHRSVERDECEPENRERVISPEKGSGTGGRQDEPQKMSPQVLEEEGERRTSQY